MWRDNEALAQEYQLLKAKLTQLQDLCNIKNNDIERERVERQNMNLENERLRA